MKHAATRVHQKKWQPEAAIFQRHLVNQLGLTDFELLLPLGVDVGVVVTPEKTGATTTGVTTTAGATTAGAAAVAG